MVRLGLRSGCIFEEPLGSPDRALWLVWSRDAIGMVAATSDEVSRCDRQLDNPVATASGRQTESDVPNDQA
jgi:hypothetical protein